MIEYALFLVSKVEKNPERASASGRDRSVAKPTSKRKEREKAEWGGIKGKE
jgi:hypothetical protein